MFIEITNGNVVSISCKGSVLGSYFLLPTLSSLCCGDPLSGEGPVSNYDLFTGSSLASYCVMLRHSASGTFPLKPSWSGKTESGFIKFIWILLAEKCDNFVMCNSVMTCSVSAECCSLCRLLMCTSLFRRM